MPLDTKRNFSYYHNYLANGESHDDCLSVEEKAVLDRYKKSVETQYDKDSNVQLRYSLFRLVTYLAAAFSEGRSGYDKHAAVVDVRHTIYNHTPLTMKGEKDLEFMQSIVSPLSILFQILEADYDDAWTKNIDIGGDSDSGKR